VFVVLLGAPLLAGGRGGLGLLFGPTLGYMLGFVPAAFVSGLVMARRKELPVFTAALIAAVAGGIVVEHLCGVIGLMAVARMSLLQALAATAVFVPGDVLKAIAAAFVAEAAHRSYPSAIFSRP
jgi:biotin transport system substrate-specific component